MQLKSNFSVLKDSVNRSLSRGFDNKNKLHSQDSYKNLLHIDPHQIKRMQGYLNKLQVAYNKENLLTCQRLS